MSVVVNESGRNHSAFGIDSPSRGLVELADSDDSALGHRHIGMEHWMPLFHDTLETLFDYLPDTPVSLDPLNTEARAARLAAQQAGETIREAVRKMDANRFEEALRDLEEAAAKLRAQGRPELVKDGLDAIVRAISNYHEGWRSRRGRKTARYDARSLRIRSSREYWSGDESQRPSFKEPRPE